MTIPEAIKFIVDQNDKKLLTDSKRFKSYLLDLCSDNQKELKIINRALDDRILERIFGNERDNVKISRLRDEFEVQGMSESWSEFIIGSFASVLSWNYKQKETTENNISKSNQKFSNTANDFHNYLKLAEQGDPEAQNKIGDIYRLGQGVKTDYKEAVKWYKKSAEQGNAYGQCYLGYMYENACGVEKNYKEAIKWYRKSFNQGNGQAQYFLACFYKDGKGTEKDYEKAVKYYKKATKQGIIEAYKCLGDMYKNGYEVEKDEEEADKYYQKAIKLLKKSAEEGNFESQCFLGDMYLEGEGVEKNYKKAIKYFIESAKQGYAPAQNNLGYMYYNGYGVEKDYTLALNWYKKAAKQGSSEAQNNLAVIFYQGDFGIEQDYEEAFKWFKKSAKQGNANAQKLLAQFYKHGLGIEQNLEEAFKWFKKAAENEDSDENAQALLGNCYEYGTGTLKNYKEAIKWYTKAANNGDGEAQAFMGLYHSGISNYLGGGSVDYEKALKFAKQSAEQKNNIGEYLLGYFYEYGICVPIDYDKAKEYLKMSADQGNKHAIEELKYLKEKTTDYIEKESKQKIENSNSFKTAFVGDYIEFGNYPQTLDGEVQPIEWKVLAKKGNKILVISKYGLDAKRFDDNSNDWASSEIRYWLNDKFYNKAFTEKEKKSINLSNLSDVGTSDKVFLLSKEEAENYFVNDKVRRCKATEYAVKNGAFVDDNGYSWWWLRSPNFGYYSSDYVYYVNSLGFAGNFRNADSDDRLVRPALWINI